MKVEVRVFDKSIDNVVCHAYVAESFLHALISCNETRQLVNSPDKCHYVSWQDFSQLMNDSLGL